MKTAARGALLLALTLVPLAVAFGGRFHSTQPRSTTPAPSGYLKPLSCDSSTSCELQLVADDWDGSSATWTARTGSNATKSVTPTKGASTTFAGRASIDATSGCFLMASGTDNITTTSTKTYELIIDNFGTALSQHVLARRDGGNTQIAYWIYKVNNTVIETDIYNSAVAVFLGSVGSTLTADMSSKPVFFTVTLDIAGSSMITYQNGVAIATDTTTTGSITNNVAMGLGIGCGWNAGAREGAFAGKILEVLRHNRVLSAAEVAARVAKFNALKGY